jgi:CHASE2 domain-containing sensor protein
MNSDNDTTRKRRESPTGRQVSAALAGFSTAAASVGSIVFMAGLGSIPAIAASLAAATGITAATVRQLMRRKNDEGRVRDQKC